MASWLRFINRLLPFATPGTPLVQDLLHLAAICGVLYVAPQVQEYLHRRRFSQEPSQPLDRGSVDDDADHNVVDDSGATNLDLPNEATDDARAADAEDNVAPVHQVEDDHAEAGPANARDTPATNQRAVGSKKAKSLAKKDQRRAYHEFMRSQGEAQRERDADGAAERDAALEAERQRRKATEAALEAKKAKEREAKREMERKGREEEIKRRESAVRIVREDLDDHRTCDLFKVAKQVGGDVDEEWVERILKATGMLGKRDGVLTMITGMGWIVRVSQEDMADAYRMAVEREGTNDGRVSYDELGTMLEASLRTHAVK